MKNTLLLSVLILSFMSCKTDNKSDSQNEILEKQEKVEVTKLDIPKNQKLTKEQQIQSAVIAAPKESREETKVYGYSENGELIVLREGNNEFICIADNPSKDGFEVVCYHKSLEPFMNRGRVLNSEGKNRQEKEEIRESEAASGVMPMPKNPATLHIFYGENGYFNTETSQIENAKYRYVVYIPYATPESTGLPLKPNAPSHPWLMFPGKYNAHIMISPTE
jgi:hypothetical protein